MTPGKTILHYKILEKLGEGGMGVVYKAEDLKLKRFVALKFLHPYLIGQPRTRERMKREARAAASLNHPNICTIYEYHEIEDSAFIVMEYIEGETLKQIIDRDGPLSQEKATDILKQIAAALTVAHNNDVIHRDIKSENIMITKDGQVKVTDFGLAKLKDAPTITKTKSPMGTVGYMSPELVQGEEVDHRTDLWSLGVILFEMLMGELPFKGESDVRVMYSIVDDEPDLSSTNQNFNTKFFKYIILKLLEKDVKKRYSTAEGVIKDIQYGVSQPSTRILLRKIQKKKNLLLFVTVFFLLFCIISFQLYKDYSKPFWLKKHKKLTQLTYESDDTKGRISPDGSKIVYRSGMLNFRVRDLITGEDFKVFESDTYKVDFGMAILPIWSPDGNHIAYVSGKMNSVSKIDWRTKKIINLTGPLNGLIYYLDWSPNGDWISFSLNDVILNEHNVYTVSLNMVKSDGSGMKRLNIRSGEGKYPYQMTWYPNNRKLAFYEVTTNPKSKIIRQYDIETEQISKPIYSLKYTQTLWYMCGLSYSPDGKFLIFPESINNGIELVAIPVKKQGSEKSGDPIQITNIAGIATPYCPEFDATGGKMSFVLRQYDNKIFKSSLNLNNKQIASKISPFTKSNHSLNYACWSLDGEKLVYIDKPIDQYNVYLLDLNTNKEKILFEDFQMKTQLRFIPENESLSFLTLDWELWELPIDSEQPRIIFPRLPEAQTINIHNYCWGKTSNYIYAIISRKDSSDWRGIVKLNLNSQSIESVIKKIKTPKLVQWELRLSPDGNKLGLRCHPDDNSKYQEIRIIDVENQAQRLIMRTLPVIPVGELSWTPDSQFLVFGAYTEKHDFNIYYYSVRDKTLNIFSSRPLTESYYPGQISPKGDEIILYMEKENSNIWMLSEN